MLIRSSSVDTWIVLVGSLIVTTLCGLLAFGAGVSVRHDYLQAAVMIACAAVFPTFLAVVFQPRLLFSVRLQDDGLELAVGRRKIWLAKSEVISITPHEVGRWRYILIKTPTRNFSIGNLLWARRDFDSLSDIIYKFFGDDRPKIIINLDDVSLGFRRSGEELLVDWSYYGFRWAGAVLICVAIGAVFAR